MMDYSEEAGGFMWDTCRICANTNFTMPIEPNFALARIPPPPRGPSDDHLNGSRENVCWFCMLATQLNGLLGSVKESPSSSSRTITLYQRIRSEYSRGHHLREKPRSEYSLL